jgi:hypothetical protein
MIIPQEKNNPIFYHWIVENKLSLIFPPKKTYKKNLQSYLPS